MAARTTKWGISFGIAVLGLLTVFESDMLAQSGSIGGSVGDTNKTLSGERATGPNAPARPRPKTEQSTEKANRTAVQPPEDSVSGCKGLLGTWTFSNGIGVMFKAGGELSATNRDAGRWTCDGGMVAAHWSKWTDHYVISSDGAHISGNSGVLNIGLTATKN